MNNLYIKYLHKDRIRKGNKLQNQVVLLFLIDSYNNQNKILHFLLNHLWTNNNKNLILSFLLDKQNSSNKKLIFLFLRDKESNNKRKQM